MATSDYALIISILSLLISLGAFVWNIWQKFIFVKPVIQVGFALGSVLMPAAYSYQANGKKLLTISATNMGPGPAILTLCIAKSRSPRFWTRRQDLAAINPIDGNPAAENPVGKGPIAGGLPAKLDAGESKSFYMSEMGS